MSWHKAGFKSGIISGRGAGEIVQRRADELGIEFVRVASEDKVKDFEEIISGLDIGSDSGAYIGDDIGDVELMKRVGFAVAVADAVDETKAAAAVYNHGRGRSRGRREVVDLLLKGQKK